VVKHIRRRFGTRALALVAFAAASRIPCTAGAHPSADDRLHAIELEIADTSPSARLLTERGRANLQAGRWQKALDDADGALALKPRSSEALLLRAETLFASGSVDRALAAAEALLAIAPASATGHHLRARALRDVGRLDEAAAEYDRFLGALKQPLPEHYIERAEVQAALGRTDAALRSLDEGVTRIGSGATLQLAAVDLAVKGDDLDAAVARLDLLLRQAPGQVFWMTRRAEILERSGRHEEARRAFFDAALALPPANVAALRRLKERIEAGQKRLDNVEVAAHTGEAPRGPEPAKGLSR